MAQIRQIQMGNLATDLAALPTWAVTLGGYAGSWAGGAGVGYVVARSAKGAATGGLTTSGIWAVVSGTKDYQLNHPAVTAGLFGLGFLSLYLAWQRG